MLIRHGDAVDLFKLLTTIYLLGTTSISDKSSEDERPDWQEFWEELKLNGTRDVNFSQPGDILLISCPKFQALHQEGLYATGKTKNIWGAMDSSVDVLPNENATMTTEVCLEHAPQLTPSTVTRVVVLSIIATISYTGNLAVLASIRNSNTQRRSTVYFLIGHLAFSDLFVTTFCVVAEAAWTYTVQWLAGTAMCKIIKFMQMFSLYLSTFLLVVIGYDRFMAIKYPMSRANAKRRVIKLIFAAWALSAFFSLPQVSQNFCFSFLVLLRF